MNHCSIFQQQKKIMHAPAMSYVYVTQISPDMRLKKNTYIRSDYMEA